MNKEDKEFLDEIEKYFNELHDKITTLQRDTDYRFQKIKEQNYDLQSKVTALIEELQYSRTSIWRSIWRTIYYSIKRIKI